MAGVDRGHAYYTQDTCADTLDVMNKRLSQDLRNRVRRVAHYPPMTPEWREVADIVHHLGQVACMESKEVTKRDGTVWEREELCVRYIIEESKTNMLLRMMVDFKKFCFESAMQNTCQDPEALAVMKTFEAGLGELLRCLLTAVEALQTLDIPAFVEYAADVLNAAIASGCCDAQSQEVVIINYLHSVMLQLEKIQEDRVLDLCLDHHILPLVLNHFELYREKVGDDGVEMYLWMLSYFFDSEYFQGHRAKFMTPDVKKRLVLLESSAKAVKATESDADRRKKIRVLCDTIIRYK
eukprot:TRINITY_DN20635_c0_g1_i1.p1 TRINITY_DN20635_c0_g1~~TRINITY_DN20635_c0_g1_i1.p1  ORF type:complete len:295 (+),score=102.89 TRINITY_DN20635_c0_g1_i1:41-925(+)